MKLNKPIVKFIIMFFFSIFITIPIISFSQASKTVDFLRDQKANLVNSPTALMAATAITQYQGEMDAFVLKDSLISETYASGLSSMNFEIFSVTTFNDDQAIDKLAFYLTDVSIQDDSAIHDNQGNLSIFIEIMFNQSINQSDERTYQIPFVSVYDVDTYLIFFEYSKWQKGLSTPLRIESITIEYEIENAFLISTIYLPPSRFSHLDENHYQPSLAYLDNFAQNENVFYNANLLTQFKSYWHYDLYFLGGEMTVLGLIFWLVFILPARNRTKKSNHP